MVGSAPSPVVSPGLLVLLTVTKSTNATLWAPKQSMPFIAHVFYVVGPLLDKQYKCVNDRRRQRLNNVNSGFLDPCCKVHRCEINFDNSVRVRKSRDQLIKEVTEPEFDN